jgi:hypothetical protein
MVAMLAETQSRKALPRDPVHGNAGMPPMSGSLLHPLIFHLIGAWRLIL